MTEWMRCEEEMPIFLGVRVLVYTVNRDIYIGKLVPRGEDDVWQIEGKYFDQQHVTHWKPLCEPPQETQ